MANSFVKEAKNHLLEKQPECFFDPVTTSPPKDEEQLSGLLGLFHQLGRVAWSEVPLWLPTNERAEVMADKLFAQTAVCAEYQLFWISDQEKNSWGQMRADLAFLSRDGQTVCILENKIGSDFTYKNDPQQQLDRQIAFLSTCKIPRRVLVLLSGADFFEKGWYCKQFATALERSNRGTEITGYLMKWEEVFRALR
jgi:hypothetical protein